MTSSTGSATVSVVEPDAFDWSVTEGVAADMRDLIGAAARADGREPMDEATLLMLRHTGLAGAALWTSRDREGALLGFALGDARPGSPSLDAQQQEVAIHLVVHPAARRTGIGTGLAQVVSAAFPGLHLTAWSHGHHPGGAAIAKACGLRPVRELWLMRRDLGEPLPDVATPAEVGVRTFLPGQDEDAVLELNAAAFASHQEQGGLDHAGLAQRMAEPWFDPAGFFLAEERSADDRPLLGFHWTKVHPGRPPYGEVYVVAVSPTAQGRGLGSVLTTIGLRHLASQGLHQVVLYVESDNAAAVAVYAGLGFTHAPHDTDVMYRR